jgi:hypothetical protein
MLDSDYAEILGKLSDTEKNSLKMFLQNPSVDRYFKKNLEYKAITIELSSFNLTLFNIGCLESLKELLQMHTTTSLVV